MDYTEFLKIKNEWKGGPCDHPGFEKIFYAGAFLISYACVKCGREFSIAEKMELALERKRSGSVKQD